MPETHRENGEGLTKILQDMTVDTRKYKCKIPGIYGPASDSLNSFAYSDPEKLSLIFPLKEFILM